MYTVTSNGDIKADYKTNPVQFPVELMDLTLITCYPPGFHGSSIHDPSKFSYCEPI